MDFSVLCVDDVVVCLVEVGGEVKVGWCEGLVDWVGSGEVWVVGWLEVGIAFNGVDRRIVEWLGMVVVGW